jgi:copper chaperone CopZ
MSVKPPSTLVGSLIAGFLASICCIGPLVLGTLGLGSFGLAGAIAPLRPWLLSLTGILLAVAFFFAYRPLPKSVCGPDGVCAPAVSRRGQRVGLWIVTSLTIGMATFPQWSPMVFASGAPVRASNAHGTTQLVTLDVQGMTCADCEGHIEREIGRISGVISADVDYAKASGVVQFADQVDVEAVTAAVERAGYRASNLQVSKAAPSGSFRSEVDRGAAKLTGEWRGSLTVGKGKTSELVLDIDRAAERWVGQFDLIEFGVEDYPILIEIDGGRIHLNLTAAQIDFEGSLSARGDSLLGAATSQGNRDSLVLVRRGDPQLSADFLALEAVAEDSTRVTSLGSDGSELRKQFNDDRAHTRLLMLLSPT